MIELVRYEDIIQPFMLHHSVVRGRMVRLGEALGAILSRHAYPEPVSRSLGELLLLGAMLSANLPEKGILTLQIKGNGPVPLMVVDVQADGNIRGYATVTDEARDELSVLPASPALAELFGTGYLAITLDTPHGEPYQGIVPLEGANLSEAVAHYFTQSQQLDVMFHLAITRRTEEETAHWIAAGIMLERMPDARMPDARMPDARMPDARMPDARNSGGNHEEIEIVQEAAQPWEYQSLLVLTATDEELCDPYLAPGALLYRLFNEEGVWVYDTQPLQDRCRCSREKISHVLEQLPAAEVEELYENGVISVTCQFCSREERFTHEDVSA